MKILILINDAPYGSEKAYNALRLAMTLRGEHKEVEINIFLMGDAVACALPSQSTHKGYYNIERMLDAAIRNGAQVKACGSCIESRGMKELLLIEGVEFSNMSELTRWVVEADKVVTF